MQRQQTIQHAVRKKNGIIKEVGRCSILEPKVNYSGKGSTKWFDDSKLIRKH